MRKLILASIVTALLAPLASCNIPEAYAAPTIAMFGNGADGAVTFDGTSTVLGLAPASDVYTMTRPIYCNGCTINAAATVFVNGNPFYDENILTVNGTIEWNGSGAAGTTPGASTGDIFYSGTEAGGTASAGVGGASAQAFCAPYLATTVGGAGGTSSHVGGNGGTAVGGGGGGTVAGAGGSGGALTTTVVGACWDLDLMLRTGRFVASMGPLTFATGGGGGGGAGAGAGGAGAGLVFVGARVLAGSGSIAAIGGHGGNATASGSGGGGGGGGGFIAVEYETNTGAVSTSVAGGSAGSGSGAGSNGGSGGSGIVFKNCSTCLGLNLSGDGT